MNASIVFSSWAFWTGLHFLGAEQWKGVGEYVSLVPWTVEDEEEIVQV